DSGMMSLFPAAKVDRRTNPISGCPLRSGFDGSGSNTGDELARRYWEFANCSLQTNFSLDCPSPNRSSCMPSLTYISSHSSNVFTDEGKLLLTRTLAPQNGILELPWLTPGL